MNLADLHPTPGEFQSIYCGKCEGYLDLIFSDFHENVSGIDMRILGLPALYCEKCDLEFLPEKTRFEMIHLHQQAVTQEEKSIDVTRNGKNQTFNFTAIPFSYDSDDYKYFPGLERQHDEGFLTPVFFNREVLLKYDKSPIYHLRYTSATYGHIWRDEFSMPFGTNKNGKVLMWLGDVARLPDTEQYYLKSENIESDHSIGSEFYDAEIECKFTEHSNEEKLFAARSEFLAQGFKRFGEKLAHLDGEVQTMLDSFNSPVVDTPQERRHVADVLNQVYLESFNRKALVSILSSLGEESGKLGTIKLLQKIFEKIAPEKDISTIMCGLYVLYDLRVEYSHIGSKGGSDSRIKDIETRLGLSQEAPLIEIYGSLINQLSSAFVALSDIVEHS